MLSLDLTFDASKNYLFIIYSFTLYCFYYLKPNVLFIFYVTLFLNDINCTT